MTISRRQFLLGASAGFILPSFYEKALGFIEQYGEPLIESPNQTDIEMFALNLTGDGLELNWGDSWSVPEMTVREFASRYCGGEEGYSYMYAEEDEIDFDARADEHLVVDTWLRKDSPTARAYHFLESIDLGPTLAGANAVGELTFIDGPCPGNDYLGVEAADLVSVSLLQKRLNDLNTKVRISMA